MSHDPAPSRDRLSDLHRRGPEAVRTFLAHAGSEILPARISALMTH